MTHDAMQRERLSAMADGHLHESEWNAALDYAGSAAGQQTWHLYHLVGEVLRAPQWAHGSGPDVLPAVRARLAQEGSVRPLSADPGGTMAHSAAANDPVRRWKLAAACACLSTAAAVGWNVLAHWRTDALARTADFPLESTAQSSAVIAIPAPDSGQSAMLRDPHLEALLSAATRTMPAAALQMPAGFLRNASFAAADEAASARNARGCASAHC